MKRRQIIASSIAALSTLTGCIGMNTVGVNNQTPSRQSPTPKGPIRGESSIERSVTRTEMDDSTEYLEETEQVQYVARLAGGGPSSTRRQVYETTPFKEWAKTRCAVIAADAAKEHAAKELETGDISAGISSAVENKTTVAMLELTAVLNRKGETIQTASVSTEELVKITPDSIDSTYILESRSYERAVPVYVQLTVAKEM